MFEKAKECLELSKPWMIMINSIGFKTGYVWIKDIPLSAFLSWKPYGHYMVTRCPPSFPIGNVTGLLCEYVSEISQRWNSDGVLYKNRHCWECWKDHDCDILRKVKICVIRFCGYSLRYLSTSTFPTKPEVYGRSIVNLELRWEQAPTLAKNIASVWL